MTYIYRAFHAHYISAYMTKYAVSFLFPINV
jgi:hypothetical protein